MKKSMKKTLIAVLALVFALSVPFTSVAEPAVNVTVMDDPVVWTDAEPFIDANNRTLVPLRAVGEALDLTVEWDAENRTAVFIKEYTTSDGFIKKYIITFPIGSNVADGAYNVTYPDGFIDSWGEDIMMDTEAVIVNSRTYAPVRYLAEFFGYEVTWNPDTRTVGIGIEETAQNFNFFSWSLENVTPNTVSFVVVPGEDHELVKDFKIKEARVNGKPVKVSKTNKVECIPEGVDPDDCYGICVEWDFARYDDLTVSFDIVVNTTDYRTLEYTNTFSGIYGYF